MLKVIAENLESTEEVKGLKQMFNNMDTDKSGSITYEELKTGLSKLGSRLAEQEIQQLMEAVSFLLHAHCDMRGQNYQLSKFKINMFSDSVLKSTFSIHVLFVKIFELIILFFTKI